MKKPPAHELIRLWGTTWEAWELSPGRNPQPRLLGPAAGRKASAKIRILALPARLVIAAPLWVESTDEEVIRTSSELEVEVRGLLPRKKSADAVISRRLDAHGKTLVVGAIFPVGTPKPYSEELFSNYEASPFLIDAVEDGVALWREGNDLVAVFTRGRRVVSWATLDWPARSAEITAWLEMVLLQLTATGILETRPRRVVLDSTLEDGNLTSLLPDVPQETTDFSPSFAHADFRWKPEQARQREDKADATRKIRRVALALAALYLIFALAAGIHLGWLHWKSRQIQHRIAELETATAEFQPAVREWRQIGPGAETDYFPIEILHRVVRNMPASGIRLTIYDLVGGHVTIEGEATSASLASQFFTAVSHDQDLQVMNWQMPTPALLPSSAARFQLTGQIP